MYCEVCYWTGLYTGPLLSTLPLQLVYSSGAFNLITDNPNKLSSTDQQKYKVMGVDIPDSKYVKCSCANMLCSGISMI